MSRVTAVIPTLGTSPLLADCLAALRADGPDTAIVVVAQGAGSDHPALKAADRVVRLADRAGFSRATNAGIAFAETPFVATINDDLVIEPGWHDRLVQALAETPEAAAAQGVNVSWTDPALCDGAGLAWNRRLQAEQLGHGRPVLDKALPPREIFGVSATAALWRTDCLRAASLPGGAIFDEGLDSYYEDTDLASRLRAAGWRALLVPAARARHSASSTVASLPLRRWSWVYGNRYLVLARLLGGRFWARLPRALVAEAGEALHALGAPARLGGLVIGLLRAAKGLPAYARRGAPAVAESELVRLGVETFP